jgi:hypothetical protein
MNAQNRFCLIVVSVLRERLNRAGNTAQVAAHQRHRCGSHCHIRSSPNCQPHIRLRERGRIVHAVTDHRHYI